MWEIFESAMIVVALSLFNAIVVWYLDYIKCFFRVKNFIYKLRTKDGSSLCKKCGGSGEIDEIYGPYKCSVCNGTGKLDWVKTILEG